MTAQVHTTDIRRRLRKLDRRNWVLWSSSIVIILSLTAAVLSFSLTILAKADEPFFQLHISQSMRGLVGVVLLFAVYTVYQQTQLYRMRVHLEEQIEFAAEQQVRADEFMNLALVDPLTGLHNRRFAERQLAAEMSRAQRHGYALTVLSIDLDDFKSINDHYGHHAGDLVLQAFAERFKRATRGSDFAARFGGDEFLGLLPECGMAEIQHVLNRLRPLEVKMGDALIPVTFSAGWTDYEKGESTEELLKRADHALYVDKKAKKK